MTKKFELINLHELAKVYGKLGQDNGKKEEDPTVVDPHPTPINFWIEA